MLNETRRPRVQTFSAATMNECLQQAKRALGAEAVILNKKTRRRGAILGRWGGRDVVEVTCALEPEQSPSFDPNATIRPDVGLRTARLDPNATIRPDAGLRAAPFDPNATIRPDAGLRAASAAPSQARLQALEAQIALLVSQVAQRAEEPPPANVLREPGPVENSSAPPSGAPKPYPELRSLLAECEVADMLAAQWLAALPQDLGEIHALRALQASLGQQAQIAGPLTLGVGNAVQIWAFLGPTGAGKTTTLAKLAARHARLEGRRVAIVTLDTQRIAAAHQAQLYGEMLQVPVRVAYNRAELAGHLAELAASKIELVLLDTPSCSPNAIPEDTARVFDGLNSLRKFLLLPAALSARDMEHALTCFGDAFSPDALILTKLDETESSACWGRLLSVQSARPLPLALLTTGQAIPDDLADPDPNEIARWLLA